jgi:hypothetical protein
MARILPEIPLVLAPVTADAKAAVGYKWAEAPIGRRHKIAGTPDWIQGTEVPRCSCGKSMSFYAQIDSVGDDIDLADCGMIYVFVCFDCFTTHSQLQSY